MSRKLSKLICFHNSEWGAEYSSLETEVTAFFDKHIEDADKKVKQDLEDKKTASLEALKPKVGSLDFWSEVKVVTTQKEVAATNKPKEEKQVLVPFPTSPKVYHFHPIAFVEQMRMMNVDLVYDIYHTGRVIESGDQKKAKKASFIYHDKNGVKHKLGTWKLIEVEAYANGIKAAKMPKDKSTDNYKGIPSSKYGMVYYKKLGYRVKVLNYMEHAKNNVAINHKKENITIKFSSYSDRKYVSCKSFSALLGALAEVGYEDVKINGFTSIDGTGSPSLTHPKGVYFDMGILNKNKTVIGIKITNELLDVTRNNQLLNSLYKFGYKEAISNYYKEKKLLNHCRRDASGIHNNHLHLQKFKPE